MTQLTKPCHQPWRSCFPGQEGNGTHVNISGAGLVSTSPNPENAIKFLEYLTSEPAQLLFANGNNEYPAVPGIAATSAVVGLGEFNEDMLNASELGINRRGDYGVRPCWLEIGLNEGLNHTQKSPLQAGICDANDG